MTSFVETPVWKDTSLPTPSPLIRERQIPVVHEVRMSVGESERDDLQVVGSTSSFHEPPEFLYKNRGSSITTSTLLLYENRLNTRKLFPDTGRSLTRMDP